MKILLNESQYKKIVSELAKSNIEYWPFEKAREFARNLNLKDAKAWVEYSKSGKKPLELPGNPNDYYKGEFKGYGDFLGTGNLGSIGKSRQYWPYEDAREYVRELKLKDYNDWVKYAKSSDRPLEIPSAPHQVYPEFKGYKDWVGEQPKYYTQRAKIISPKFLPFRKAREFVRSLNLGKTADWNNYVKSGKKPENIPYNPLATYGTQFKGMNDWLGSEYLPYEEAKKYVNDLNIKKTVDYKSWAKNKNNPINIPGRPDIIYKGKGWVSWKEFLRGTPSSTETKSINKKSEKLTQDQRIQKLLDRISSLENLLKEKGVIEEQKSFIENKLRLLKEYYYFLK